MWKRTTNMATEGFQALGAAFHQKTKYCHESNAGPHCIRVPDGLGAAAQWAGYALLAVFATSRTLRAIESPGGGDDRQWLTFWVVMCLFSFSERFTDALLSRFPAYYEAKLIALWWLLFCHGAEKVYRRCRRRLTRSRVLKYVLRMLFNRGPEVSGEDYASEASEAASLASLPESMRAEAKARSGVAHGHSHDAPTAFLEAFRSERALVAAHGEATLVRLRSYWNVVDPRYLVLTLGKAEHLPCLAGDIPDAYVVCSLIPPPLPTPTPSSQSVEGPAAVVKQEEVEAEEAEDPAASGGAGAGAGSAIPTASGSLWSAMQALTELRLGLLLFHLRRALTLAIGDAVNFDRRNGPTEFEGRRRAYGHTLSRTINDDRHPQWNEAIELRLEGGVVSASGDFDNAAAPFSALRLEVWDSDLFDLDDFLGEVTIPLMPLMDMATHQYVGIPLSDPEGKVRGEGAPHHGSRRIRPFSEDEGAGDGSQPTITFSLCFES